MLQCRYFMRDQILKSKQHWEPITGKPKSKQAKIPLKPSNTHKYIATEILQATKGQDLRHQFHQSWPKAQNTHKLDGRKTQKKVHNHFFQICIKLQLPNKSPVPHVLSNS